MIVYNEIIVLLSGVLGMYARYNFLQAFKEDKRDVSNPEKIVFIWFYVSLHLVYFKLNIPILNLLTQVFFLVMIGLILRFSIKKILLSTSMIALIIVAIDSIVFFMTGYVSSSIFIESGYQSILGIIAVDMLTLIVSIVFKNYKNISKNIILPLIYWISVFIFPVMSLGLLIIIFTFSEVSRFIVIGSSAMILMMNFIVFWLYDHLIYQYEKKLDEIVVNQMTISYKKQLELMQSSIINLRSLKHDMRSHIASMSILLEKGFYNELKNYLDETKHVMQESDMVSHTGNLIIDSIINFEVNSFNGNEENVEIVAINIPKEIRIRDYDMTVVLSNVISNALIAVQKVKDGKIKIKLQYEKGILIIAVENNFDGKIIVEGNEFTTTQTDKANHGYGIGIVKRTVEKYDGEAHIDYENNTFRIEIIMYEEA